MRISDWSSDVCSSDLHRTLIARSLKGLEDLVPVSVVHWRMLEHGWTFADGPGVTPDPVMGAKYLHQLYTRARPGMTGRVTVPLLWDTATDTVVSNESWEIIRMFNTAYYELGARPGADYTGGRAGAIKSRKGGGMGK